MRDLEQRVCQPRDPTWTVTFVPCAPRERASRAQCVAPIDDVCRDGTVLGGPRSDAQPPAARSRSALKRSPHQRAICRMNTAGASP